MTADHLISADIIASDGSLASLGDHSTLENPLISNLYSTALAIRDTYADAIKENWPHTWRNSAGYRLNYLLPWSPSKPSQWKDDYPPIHPSDFPLHPLLAGSEGTLAIIRRAKVNLVAKPRHTILAVLAYQSNADACDDVPRLLAHHPSAVELIPQMIIRLARGVPAYARQMGWVIGDPAALLVVEFSGDDPLALKESAHKIGDILTIAESKEDQARVWNVRRVGLGLLDSRPQSARPVAFIEDCAIPVQRLGEFVRDVETILAAHGTEGGMYAHASAGCLHIRPILNLKTARGVSALRSISEAVLSLTLKLGGAMSSEHGDGLARSEFLDETYGRELMDAMRLLKRAADPKNILNPGKVIDAPKMDINLRYGLDYDTRLWETNLSFMYNGGLDVAIEQCNGQGLCRKDTGVMCPSYQATREEMHSTRGRANLLRALITNYQLREGQKTLSAELTQSVAGAIDLCLACKGCKAECPSGVDMAKLKFAFQAEYYKTHRRQLRDYAFGYFHVSAGLAASVAPMTNALMEITAIRNLVAKVLGITPHRPFPKFSSKRARQTAETPRRSSAKRVILLSDTFARYLEPETEQAAFDILSACGLEVYVLPVLGAGASFLSKAFIDQARAHAGRVLDLLHDVDAESALPVIGIEPPEIYTLKHDYIGLCPERAEEIQRRVAKVWLLDEFLLRSEEFNDLRIANIGRLTTSENRSSTDKVYFHPHCHQRAQGLSPDGLPNGTNATLELLRSCGYEVELMDTGCCGMAGTFGYEAEHYELSVKVGELKLFPKLRELESETRHGKLKIVSSGAACRMQIRQGTAVDVTHPMLLVANLVEEWWKNDKKS
jgi:Fe-S oxidoreductase